jgi:murein DD-endopeptidase MepM/ murein hydrolase activator NlpD
MIGYRPPVAGTGMGRRVPRWTILLVLVAGFAAWRLMADSSPPAPRPAAATPVTRPAIVDTMRPDQTLSHIWEEHGLPPEDLPAVVHAGQSLMPWRSLRPGAVYKFLFSPDGSLRRFDLRIDRDHRLVVHRIGPLFQAELIETQFVRKSRSVSVCLDVSPWQALQDAGEDPTLVLEMAEVLAAQVDFYTDLRPEDCFQMAFEVDERPDGSYRLAGLEAVRLATREKTVEAYRFAPPGRDPEWYDAEGQSLKRMFLRSPLKFTRISSGFGVRMHPILRRMRAHNGVDYVAPVGTPVQASGDGVVMQAGRNGGYGLYIKLNHGQRYSTSYAHLSRIAPGVRTGARVQQGQVIGYVGSTGLSTGAHLDYRFMKDGQYVDPLTADLPTAIPLEGNELAAFQLARDGLRQRFEPARAGSDAAPAPAR